MSCSKSFLRCAVGGALLLTAFVSASGQKAGPKPAASPEQSCLAHVKRFYDWYVPAVFDENAVPASIRAIKGEDFSFDVELRRRLLEDSEASARIHDEIVGLDFDPFLDTQEPEHHYTFESPAIKNGRCRVEVHSQRASRRTLKPDVVPELELRGERWVFLNFYYPQNKNPEDGDLLSVLRVLRKQRSARH